MTADNATGWITLLCTAAQIDSAIGGSTNIVNLGSCTLALHHVRGNETATARLPIGQHVGAVLHGCRFAETPALGALPFTCVCRHFVEQLTVFLRINLEGAQKGRILTPNQHKNKRESS